MNPIQQAVQAVETTDLNDYVDVFKKHSDYRISGMAKAAEQRLLNGDPDTARQWLVWAAGKLE